jgi:hypothetical protein
MASPIFELLRRSTSASDLIRVQIVKDLGYTDLAEGSRRLDRHLRGLERDPEFLERLEQVLSTLEPAFSRESDWEPEPELELDCESELEDSSNSSSPVIHLGEGLKISDEAEELAVAILNAPFGRSQLPLSSTALGEVKARILEVAPYSITKVALERGKHYTVVGKSMTCSIGLRRKRFIKLHDPNGEEFAILLCFTPEDFDGVTFAEDQAVCVALYFRDIGNTPSFLPLLVFGPSGQGDRLIVIRPKYADNLLK